MHGAPRGTTARLRGWLAKLAELVNKRGASPEIVTRTIMFFRPPTHLKEYLPDPSWEESAPASGVRECAEDAADLAPEPDKTRSLDDDTESADTDTAANFPDESQES